MSGVTLSVNTMAMSFLVEPATEDALSLANAASVKVMVRSATSSALAWLLALPVSVRVITESLMRENNAVRPAGTLVALTPAGVDPAEAGAKMSPVRVAVTLPVTEPSFSSASVKLPA